MIKNDIAKYVRELYRKAGYKVFNFTSNIKIRTKDWVDIVCVGHGRIILYEIKVGKDKCSPGQIETGIQLAACMAVSNQIVYAIISEKDYKEVAEKLLSPLDK